jgi:hypothetical protein
MIEKPIPANMHNAPTRRQLIAGVAVTFGGLAAGWNVWAQTQQQRNMKEAPSTAANQARTSLHQEIELKASPQRIYEILLDSKQFAAFTGMPANIARSRRRFFDVWRSNRGQKHRTHFRSADRSGMASHTLGSRRLFNPQI